MATNFEQRIQEFDNLEANLCDIIERKDAEITELKLKVEANEAVHTQQNDMQKVIDNHQRFLEKTDSFQRETM